MPALSAPEAQDLLPATDQPISPCLGATNLGAPSGQQECTNALASSNGRLVITRGGCVARQSGCARGPGRERPDSDTDDAAESRYRSAGSVAGGCLRRV